MIPITLSIHDLCLALAVPWATPTAQGGCHTASTVTSSISGTSARNKSAASPSRTLSYPTGGPPSASQILWPCVAHGMFATLKYWEKLITSNETNLVGALVLQQEQHMNPWFLIVFWPPPIVLRRKCHRTDLDGTFQYESSKTLQKPSLISTLLKFALSLTKRMTQLVTVETVGTNKPPRLQSTTLQAEFHQNLWCTPKHAHWVLIMEPYSSQLLGWVHQLNLVRFQCRPGVSKSTSSTEAALKQHY